MKKFLAPILVIAFHLLLLLSMQFTAWPEMFSFPYLLNQGFSPFQDFVHPYPPLLTILLSFLYKIFGYTIPALQLFSWTSIVIADVVLYKLLFSFTKSRKIAAAALLSYALVQAFLDGNMLWFDTALTVPLLVSILMYRKKQWLFMGIALAVACLIKQTAVGYLGISFIAVLLTTKTVRPALTLIIPSVLVLVLGVMFLGTQTSWFLNWTILFPIHYWSQFPGYVNFSLSRFEILTTVVIAVPIVIAFIKKEYLLSSLGLAALIAIYPRFSFFHMQPALAVSALCLGITLLKTRKIAFVFLTFALLFILIKVPKTWGSSTRFFSSGDQQLVEKIRAKVPAGSSVYFLNLPSNYYVFTNTFPPKPWLDNYGWYYEVPGQEDAVISAFTSSPPQYILRKEVGSGNWYELGTYEPSALLRWIADNYELKEEVSKNMWLWIKKS